MISDSIANASATMVPTSRDFGKKKRTNRSAKLKQCKRDARREQWLSQVAAKNKDCKDSNVDRSSLKDNDSQRHCTFKGLDTRRRGDENNVPMHHEIEMESPSNSPTSILLGTVGAETNFTGSSSSSSSGGCCSGNITEEEVEEDDGCLDDWEAVADALAADDKRKNELNCSDMVHGSEQSTELASPQGSKKGPDRRNVSFKDEKRDCSGMTQTMQGTTRAWRPDDEFRPQSLPNLAKQHSFPVSERQFCKGGVPWARNSLMVAVPSSCPICYEDLDMTDTSFLPCACGFRLCLFCHKRILEEDGRCPGCRKTYEKDSIKAEPSIHGGSLTFRLARSYSMVDRSY